MKEVFRSLSPLTRIAIALALVVVSSAAIYAGFITIASVAASPILASSLMIGGIGFVGGLALIASREGLVSQIRERASQFYSSLKTRFSRKSHIEEVENVDLAPMDEAFDGPSMHNLDEALSRSVDDDTEILQHSASEEPDNLVTDEVLSERSNFEASALESAVLQPTQRDHSSSRRSLTLLKRMELDVDSNFSKSALAALPAKRNGRSSQPYESRSSEQDRPQNYSQSPRR